MSLDSGVPPSPRSPQPNALPGINRKRKSDSDDDDDDDEEEDEVAYRPKRAAKEKVVATDAEKLFYKIHVQQHLGPYQPRLLLISACMHSFGA